jgi:hypothetical protein
MARPGAEEIQLDLIFDYRSNVALYPVSKPISANTASRCLPSWDVMIPAFLPAGAAAQKRDLPEAGIHLLDPGHLALEAHADVVARLIRAFLQSVLPHP